MSEEQIGWSARYSRQINLPGWGRAGQQKIGASTALIVGCGALGGHLAQLLGRAGVGKIVLVDRDVPSIHNLHRQVMCDESDVASARPKAEAAAAKLRQANSAIVIEEHVVDFRPENAETLVRMADIVLDGTDNLETRYLINDTCLKHERPWIYGGAVGTCGLVLSVTPGRGPCLRCLFPEPPPPGSLPTCEAVGVLNPLPALIAALQSTEALKILIGSDTVNRNLIQVDLWRNEIRQLKVHQNPDCPCCVQHQYRHLDDEDRTTWVTRLCDSDLVQVEPPGVFQLQLDQLEAKLAPLGTTTLHRHALRFEAEGFELFIFRDGRAVVRGTTDPAVARSLYARYIGL